MIRLSRNSTLIKNTSVQKICLRPFLSLKNSYQNSSALASAAVLPEWYFDTKVDPSEPLFKKVLIANRGEIACRVITTCKRLGIPTVAVFSDSDAQSLHVRMADEKVHIGASASKDSYLRMDRILESCHKTGSEAVHPGFGFLSENTHFASLLQENDIAFIGPPSTAIQAMGDKIESKRIAESARVNLIPGFDGAVADADEAVKVARDIGYPVMLKASAGGGGKGMRVAYNDDECVKGFQLSSQEAKSSFGDDRILVEKFIESPRHVEIQILGDQHGNYLYLHERECSIQRRNQKVIEEAPSPFIDQMTRDAMGQQAVSLAREVGYFSAGTVEFLVDKNKKFYFLEMNTRLQVEHPITECITGIDIVQEMLRVAKGYKLIKSQSDVALQGHAVECRVYAEDPTKNFGLPSIGRLYKYEEPKTSKVRCDSGIDEGSEISMYYDPMICKLVTYGCDRNEALNNMTEALDSYVIQGVTHNISLLRTCINEDKFRAGDVTTNYLYETFPDGFKGHSLSSTDQNYLSAIAALVKLSQEYLYMNKNIAKDLNKKISLAVKCNGAFVNLEVSKCQDGFDITIGDEKFLISNFSPDGLIDCAVNGNRIPIIQLLSRDSGGKIRLQYLGTEFDLTVMSPRSAELLQILPVRPKPDLSKLVKAPMAGTLVEIALKVGDVVNAGQEVCVLEAMKMQNSLTVASDGVVKKVNFSAGSTVNKDDLIVEIE